MCIGNSLTFTLYTCASITLSLQLSSMRIMKCCVNIKCKCRCSRWMALLYVRSTQVPIFFFASRNADLHIWSGRYAICTYFNVCSQSGNNLTYYTTIRLYTQSAPSSNTLLYYESMCLNTKVPQHVGNAREIC